MDMSLVLALLVSGLCSTSSSYSRYYHFVNEPMTWLEAQTYCRANYTDLATVDNMEDMKRLLKRIDPQYQGSVWIGLTKGTKRRWGWSSGEISQYTYWKPTEPNNGDTDGLCGAKYQFNGWIDADCNIGWSFVCYSEVSRKFIYISTQNTWRNAQAFCRKYYTDLATIHNKEENVNLSQLLGYATYVWMGFFYDNWIWSDRQNTTFRYWMPGQPWSSTGNANCGSVVTTWNGQWDDNYCGNKLPFMCYKHGRHRLVRLRMTSSGEKDLNDPAIQLAILNQIKETLTTNGVDDETTLNWREMNGKVFHRDKKMTIKEETCV